MCTLLVPFSDEKEIPTSVERLESADSETVVLRVQFRDGRMDWIAAAPIERELKAGKFSGKGMALCGRTDKDGKQKMEVRKEAAGVPRERWRLHRSW